MRTLPFKTIGLLAVLASTCGVAHAADDRPHALPANRNRPIAAAYRA